MYIPPSYKRTIIVPDDFDAAKIKIIPIAKSDISDVINLCSDEELIKWYSDNGVWSYSHAYVFTKLKNNYKITTQYGDFIGIIGVVDDKCNGTAGAYTHICIHREYHGKGVAYNAYKLLLQEITQRPLYAKIIKENTPSIKLHEKVGFVKQPALNNNDARFDVFMLTQPTASLRAPS